MYDGRRRGWTQRAAAENSPDKHKDGLGYFFRLPSRGAKVGGEAALLLCLPSCGAKVGEWVALAHSRLRFGPGQHTRRTRPQRPLHGAQPASFGRAGPGWYGDRAVYGFMVAIARPGGRGRRLVGQTPGNKFPGVAPSWSSGCVARSGGRGRRPARGDVIGGDSPVAFGRHWVLVIPGR